MTFLYWNPVITPITIFTAFSVSADISFVMAVTLVCRLLADVWCSGVYVRGDKIILFVSGCGLLQAGWQISVLQTGWKIPVLQTGWQISVSGEVGVLCSRMNVC
jgi:hypothetical protein